MNEFEYYVIDGKYDKAFPIVIADQGSEHTKQYTGDNFSLYHGKEIPDPKTAAFDFRDPIPRNPVIGDYFAAPDSVVSKKIADVMIPMNVKGIQIIPATVGVIKEICIRISFTSMFIIISKRWIRKNLITH